MPLLLFKAPAESEIQIDVCKVCHEEVESAGLRNDAVRHGGAELVQSPRFAATVEVWWIAKMIAD